jgi:hypothetical protein
MRRVKIILAVVAAVATMMVIAAPAMAQGWWDPIDVSRITDVDPLRSGGWEVEGQGTFWGAPAEFEWVCDWWRSCWLADVNFL